jgi:hypothetical protein
VPLSQAIRKKLIPIKDLKKKKKKNVRNEGKSKESKKRNKLTVGTRTARAERTKT